MKTTHCCALGALILIGAQGCGPLHSPMVPRLDDENQKVVDEAWNRALSPVDRLDHQEMLDVLVGHQAYQLGIDKLTLRSEKTFERGLVVMEIHFDRATPSEDRFEIKIYDDKRNLVRHERYDRKAVEQTNDELFTSYPDEINGQKIQYSAEKQKKRAEQTARWQKINSIFPKQDKKPEGKEAANGSGGRKLG